MSATSALQRLPEYEALFSNVFIKSSRALLQRVTTAAEFADADLEEYNAVLQKIAAVGLVWRRPKGTRRLRASRWA